MRNINNEQKALYEEWVKKDKELQATFSQLPNKTLSTRKIAKTKKLFDEYKLKIQAAASK